MDPRGRPAGILVLAAAAVAFIVAAFVSGAGGASVFACVLMLIGFVLAASDARGTWRGAFGGTIVALGGLVFLLANHLPFSLGLPSLAILAFILGGVVLAYGSWNDPVWVSASGAAFALAGLLWMVADGMAGANEWQPGNALALLGGVLLLISLRRRRPPRATPTAHASGTPALETA